MKGTPMRCALCDFEVDKTRTVYSKHTGLHYCTDIDNCRRRSRNKLTWAEISHLAKRAERTIQ